MISVLSTKVTQATQINRGNEYAVMAFYGTLKTKMVPNGTILNWQGKPPLEKVLKKFDHVRDVQHSREEVKYFYVSDSKNSNFGLGLMDLVDQFHRVL